MCWYVPLFFSIQITYSNGHSQQAWSSNGECSQSLSPVVITAELLCGILYGCSPVLLSLLACGYLHQRQPCILLTVYQWLSSRPLNNGHLLDSSPMVIYVTACLLLFRLLRRSGSYLHRCKFLLALHTRTKIRQKKASPQVEGQDTKTVSCERTCRKL